MPAKHKSKGRKPRQKRPQTLDPVLEASAESFPASDAPAWTSNEHAAGDVKRRKKRR